jgi:hypothetical protein
MVLTIVLAAGNNFTPRTPYFSCCTPFSSQMFVGRGQWSMRVGTLDRGSGRIELNLFLHHHGHVIQGSG